MNKLNNSILSLGFCSILMFSPLIQVDSDENKQNVHTTANESINKEIESKAASYIKEKKYNSAFQLLETYDPENKNIDSVLLKEELALKYFVTSIMHRTFAFKDLSKNEDLLSARGSTGNYTMFHFPIDRVLQELLKNNPDNCLLNRGLGDYYFEVNTKYGENWFIKSDELSKEIENQYLKSVKLGCADAFVYNVLGHQTLYREDYQTSIEFFKKALTLKPIYPNPNYGIAHAYIKLNNSEVALDYALSAYTQFDTQREKADAARMLGRIYSDLKNDLKTREYYEFSNKVIPNHYGTLAGLVDVYARIDKSKLKKAMDEFYGLNPRNPTIYHDLYDICASNNTIEDLINFYKEKLLKKENYLAIRGSLNFYLGQLYLKKEPQLAKKYIIQARDLFTQIYAKDHEVFKLINNILTSMDQ
ncbi:tetratricopeptide repeat protein [Leptospira alstonii]|uniref:tetratricopeptide repeat protein n=1 Tax=Leptospira alstonii TaxID=28452 RepID=UPI000B014752|nr:hypothetical protein [Leptospira alstonii]